MKLGSSGLGRYGWLALGAALAVCGSAAPAQAQEPICSSPSVIFCEGFESTTWAGRWGEVSHPTRKTRDTDPRNVFGGQASLRVAFPAGDPDGGGWMHYWWNAQSGQGPIYLRWYVKYQTGFNWGTWDVKMAGLEGHPPGVRYGPGAGVRPDGSWFDVRLLSLGVPNGTAAARQPLFYYSHINQNSQWGDFAHQNQNLPAVTFATDRWYCVELMVRLNDPTASNGEMSMWIDGILKGHRTGQTWRTRSDVEINHLFWSAWIGEPTHSGTQYRWEDNIVVSRARVGCSAGPGPPSPPTNLRIIR